MQIWLFTISAYVKLLSHYVHKKVQTFSCDIHFKRIEKSKVNMPCVMKMLIVHLKPLYMNSDEQYVKE